MYYNVYMTILQLAKKLNVPRDYIYRLIDNPKYEDCFEQEDVTTKRWIVKKGKEKKIKKALKI